MRAYKRVYLLNFQWHFCVSSLNRFQFIRLICCINSIRRSKMYTIFFHFQLVYALFLFKFVSLWIFFSLIFFSAFLRTVLCVCRLRRVWDCSLCSLFPSLSKFLLLLLLFFLLLFCFVLFHCVFVCVNA